MSTFIAGAFYGAETRSRFPELGFSWEMSCFCFFQLSTLFKLNPSFSTLGDVLFGDQPEIISVPSVPLGVRNAGPNLCFNLLTLPLCSCIEFAVFPVIAFRVFNLSISALAFLSFCSNFRTACWCSSSFRRNSTACLTLTFLVA
jgi:hypothetical protein